MGIQQGMPTYLSIGLEYGKGEGYIKISLVREKENNLGREERENRGKEHLGWSRVDNT